MLELRAFNISDAEKIVNWITDEMAFHKWSAGTYDKYPVSSEDVQKRYDTIKDEHPDGFYPMVLDDCGEAVGHFIIRAIDKAQGHYRFGYIIVDSTRRGKGYGKKMLRLGLEFAFNTLNAQKVTLGVFENNPGAIYCYKSVGFSECGSTDVEINGEAWKCIEMQILRADFREDAIL